MLQSFLLACALLFFLLAVKSAAMISIKSWNYPMILLLARFVNKMVAGGICRWLNITESWFLLAFYSPSFRPQLTIAPLGCKISIWTTQGQEQVQIIKNTKIGTWISILDVIILFEDWVRWGDGGRSRMRSFPNWQEPPSVHFIFSSRVLISTATLSTIYQPVRTNANYIIFI